jgi:hypothetical protein
MDKTNIAEFAEAMRRLGIVYEKEICKELVGMYYDVLKKYKMEDVARAVDTHIETSKYFPKPSEIVAIAKHKPGWENFF